MMVGVSTDVGKIRDINQDSFYYSEMKELPLFIVADGMGGQNAGEVASSLAVEAIRNFFLDNKENLLKRKIEIPKFINDSLYLANERILNEARQNSSLDGMGTTLTMAYILDNQVYIGHIGDSRAYLFRGTQLVQITQDHSLVAELVRNGSISEEEAINHPQKNIITRALGTDRDIKIDIFSREVKKNDIILLCTDGLTNMVSNEMIRDILLSCDDLQKASNTLIDTANDLGGYDNTTVMLIGIR